MRAHDIQRLLTAVPSHLQIQWETLSFCVISQGRLVLKSAIINRFTNEVTVCATLDISLPVSPCACQFVKLQLRGQRTCQFIMPALPMPALINTQSDGGKRKTRRHSEHSDSDEASPSPSGGLVPLTGGEDRTLLLAATGLRGGREN